MMIANETDILINVKRGAPVEKAGPSGGLPSLGLPSLGLPSAGFQSSVLDHRDYALWLEALQAVPEPEEACLLNWVAGPLRRFYPFERCLLLHAQQILENASITHLLHIGHEARYLEQLASTPNLEHRGSLKWWLQHRKPFVISTRKPQAHTSAFELEEIKHFGLGRIAAHGVLDITSSTGTYFSFSGVPAADDEWHHDALLLMAPMLNSHFMAYVQAKDKRLETHTQKLSSQCRKVVSHLMSGKSNRQIAEELGVAEQTVKNQLVQIYEVFDVRNRKELMAKLFR